MSALCSFLLLVISFQARRNQHSVCPSSWHQHWYAESITGWQTSVHMSVLCVCAAGTEQFLPGRPILLANGHYVSEHVSVHHHSVGKQGLISIVFDGDKVICSKLSQAKVQSLRICLQICVKWCTRECICVFDPGSSPGVLPWARYTAVTAFPLKHVVMCTSLSDCVFGHECVRWKLYTQGWDYWVFVSIQIKLANVRRCVLFHYDTSSKIIEFRHLWVTIAL